MTSISLAIVSWVLIGLGIWSIARSILKGFAYVEKLHRIPCSRCAFFTGDYRLKCTVHPHSALLEEALNCRDFEQDSFYRGQ